MADPDGSFLEQRRTELSSDDQTVPLAYDELREAARESLPEEAYGYASCGAGSGGTMRRNREAFERYRILPRVLRDVSERDLGSELLGRDIAAPLMFAPIGGLARYHDAGELAVARAASELNVGMALSTVSSYAIEDVATANGDGVRLFQLYWPRNWEVAQSFVTRAEDAGYDGIVLTVDSQIPTWRHRNLENAYADAMTSTKETFETDPIIKERAEAAGTPVRTYVRETKELGVDPSLTWDDLDALREWTDLPILLKGILSPEDARMAAKWGADGVVVSTHGGRQIDGEVAALSQLDGVVKAVNDGMPVIFDSGIRSGADAFKALSLGADVVQIGRPYLFGLAIAGERGVREVAVNLLAELESVLGLSGYPAVEDVDTRAIINVIR